MKQTTKQGGKLLARLSIRRRAMSGLGVEADAFLRAFFSGMFLCGVYEVLRLFRRIIRHHLLSFPPKIFCLAVLRIHLFGEIFQTSSGEIRWYFIAGTVAGAVAFFAVLSKTGKFCGKIFEKKTGKHGKRVD